MIKYLYSKFIRDFTITYGITVCNEFKELELLLSSLVPLISEEDEIIVLQDVTNTDERVTAVLNKYSNIKVIEGKLNNDFSAFKNQLIEYTTKEYLFQLDADEVPKETLIKHIKTILRKNRRCDCFLIPRINIVNNITDEDIIRWNWKIDDKQRINFPDYQMRLFKKNTTIKWQNKVHEVVVGYKKVHHVSSKSEDYCLMHIKSIEKQKKQNTLYDEL